MDSLPTTLVDSLPSELVGDAKTWWETLDESDRDELQRLPQESIPVRDFL